MTQTFVPVTGRKLREERTAAGAKAFEVAIEMHVNSARVSQIEALAKVTPETAERYRQALAAWSAKASS